MDYQKSVNYGQTSQPRKKGLAITSFVFGILSIVTFCAFGGALGVVGVVLGIVALVNKQSKGFAIAGIITSGVGFLLFFFVFALDPLLGLLFGQSLYY